MGFVKAFAVLLVGLFSVLLTYAAVSPVIDFLVAFLQVMGGKPAMIANMVDVIVYRVVPVLLVITYLVYAFLESTRSEDNSRW